MADHLQRMLSKKEVLKLLGITAPTLWNWQRKGDFPSSVILNPKSKKQSRVAFFEDEVLAWQKTRVRSVFKIEPDTEQKETPPVAVPARSMKKKQKVHGESKTKDC